MATEGTADEHTPGYYRGEGKMQPLDVIDAWGLDFYLGNAVKYLVRWQRKHGRQDLGKAVHYLDLAVDRARRKPGWVDAHNVDLPRSRIKGLSPLAVIKAFGLRGGENDVIYRLFEWADQGCCGCLLGAQQAARQLLDSTPEASPASKLDVAAVEYFAEVWAGLIPDLPDNYDCHLTCAEASAAADFFEAVGRPMDADAVIGSHANYDKPGDEHYDDGEPDGAQVDQVP